MNQIEYVKYKFIVKNPKKIEKQDINANKFAIYMYSPDVIDKIP